MAIVARSRPVAAGESGRRTIVAKNMPPARSSGGKAGLACQEVLQPTPRGELVGKGGVPEGPWPSATGPPGAAELHPLGGCIVKIM